MEEIIFPGVYTGPGYGISAMLIALREEGCEKMEIIIDGAAKEVKPSAADPFYSEEAQFDGLQPDTLYDVQGRVTANGKTETTTARMHARMAPGPRPRQAPVYTGGLTFSPPPPLKGEAHGEH